MSYSMTFQQPSAISGALSVLENMFAQRERVLLRQSASKTQIFFVSRIDDGLFFKNPLAISYRTENGYYVTTYKICGLVIAVAEESYMEMVNDFLYQLAESWRYYACEEDNNLTEGAIKVKEWLLARVIEG